MAVQAMGGLYLAARFCFASRYSSYVPELFVMHTTCFSALADVWPFADMRVVGRMVITLAAFPCSHWPASPCSRLTVHFHVWRTAPCTPTISMLMTGHPSGCHLHFLTVA